MASAGEIRAGRAFVELALRDNKFTQALQAISQKLANFSQSLLRISAQVGAVGLGLAGAFGKALSSFSSAGDELNRLSERTGLSVKLLSELAYAGKVVGFELSLVEDAAKNMRAALAEKNVGENVLMADMTQQFEAVLKYLASIEDATQRTEAAIEIFGNTAGPVLATYLNQGARGIEALRKEGRALGVTWTDEQARLASSTTQAWTQIRESIGSVINVIGETVAPIFKMVADSVIPVIINLRAFIERNQELIVTIVGVMAGLLAFSAIVATVGVTLFGVVVAIKAVLGVLALLTTAITALLSPIGLLVAATGGLIAIWATQTESGRKMSEDLTQSFQQIKNEFMDAWDAIVLSVKSGDLESAFEILGLAVDRLWRGIILGIREKWNEFVNWIVDSLRRNPWILPLIGAVAGGMIAGPWGALAGGLIGLGGQLGLELFHEDIKDALKVDTSEANQKLIESQERLRQAIEKANQKHRGAPPPPIMPQQQSNQMKPDELKQYLTNARGLFVATRAMAQLYYDTKREETNGLLRNILDEVRRVKQQVEDGMRVN
jgi:hypothetical protein